MTTYVRRCLIVPVGTFTKMAQDLCEGLTPGESGKGMLLPESSPTGDKPATHTINEGMIEDTFAFLLPLTTFDAQGKPTTIPGQPETIVTLAKGAVTLAQVNALLSAIEVTEEAPFVALARKGLKLIQEPL